MVCLHAISALELREEPSSGDSSAILRDPELRPQLTFDYLRRRAQNPAHSFLSSIELKASLRALNSIQNSGRKVNRQAQKFQPSSGPG